MWFPCLPLLQTSIVVTWVISTIVTAEIWPVATVIVPMSVVDVISSQNSSNGHCWCHHARCYCDMLILRLKRISKSYPSSILDVLYMHRKIMRNFPIQLVSCQNSSRINGNNQNNVLTVATSMMMSSRPLLLWRGNIHTKMDVQVAFKLYFWCFTYA
jgi:hypothetical protein